MASIILALLLSLQAHAGVLIYQNATASLTSTASLVTYTTAMTPLAQTQTVYYVSSQSYGTVSPNITDTGYANGIYTCKNQGTYSVNANIAVSGTLAVNSTVVMTIQTSPDGITWTDLKTEGAGPTTGLGKAYGKVNNLVPCPLNGQIRIMASTSVVLPTLSTVAAENSLTIVQIF